MLDQRWKKFDAKNIAGRAGRFLFHYSGRVIVLQNNFMKVIESEGEGIKHKNFDINSPKDEIDLFITKDEFLKTEDRERKQEIETLQREKNIPDFIFSSYKVISRSQKIALYDRIENLTIKELRFIQNLIRQINYKMDIDYDGFQTILNIIEPFDLNQKTKFLIEYKGENEEYSTLTHLVHYYLTEGFLGSIRFKLSQNKSVDKAISETSEFVYNILKYQVVKYLGVFNIMYKLSLSKKSNQLFEDIAGLDKLLTKLEYNALTEYGRIASDFGVPSSIVNYYESTDNQEFIKSQFDNYEKIIFEKVEQIINREQND